MEIRKSPLRPGLSYPLKPTALIGAVNDAGLTTPIALHQRTETWWTEGVLFRADFYPPSGSRSEKGNVLHVTCRSVPSHERRAAQQFLEGSVIPEFVAWLAHFEKLPDEATIKREKPSFTRSWAPATA